MELKHSIFQYDQVSAMELLNHLFKNYAKINNQLLENNKELYAEAPDLFKPIDVYFRKQEKCQKLSANGGNPISEVDMVLQLQLHIVKTGMVNSAYTKWKNKTNDERTWKKAKLWFCRALKDMETINQLTTGEAGLTVNAVVKQKSAAEETVREEIQYQLGDAFDNLALAATAKNDTIDKLVNTVAKLTATNATLT